MLSVPMMKLPERATVWALAATVKVTRPLPVPLLALVMRTQLRLFCTVHGPVLVTSTPPVPPPDSALKRVGLTAKVGAGALLSDRKLAVQRTLSLRVRRLSAERGAFTSRPVGEPA